MRPVDSIVPVQVVTPLVALIVQLLGESLLVVPDRIEWPVHSGVEQYTPPGTRSPLVAPVMPVLGSETDSAVLMKLLYEELLHGRVLANVPPLPVQVPSAGPPAS